MDLFCTRLKTLRTNKGLAQREVGEALGIAESAYRRYELGLVNPGKTLLIALADFFDVSLDYLVGRGDNPNSHKGK